MHGIYLDCQDAPYKTNLLFNFLEGMSSAGFRYLFFNPGRFFPWSEDFHFTSYYSYPEEFMQKFGEKAAQKGIVLIPVLDAGSGSGFIVEKLFYRFMAPEYPEKSEIDPDTAGTVLFFEKLMEDLFSVIPEAGYLLVLTSRSLPGESKIRFLSRIIKTAEALDKKIIFTEGGGVLLKDIRGAAGSLFVGMQHPDRSILKVGNSEIIIRRMPVLDPFTPFSGWQSLWEKSAEREYVRDRELLETFINNKKNCWEIYSTLEAEISLLIYGSTRGSVPKIFDRYRRLEECYVKTSDTRNRIEAVFSSSFEGEYIENLCLSIMEPLESIINRAEGKIRILKRRGL